MFTRCIIETDNQKTTCLESREPLNMFKVFFVAFGLFLFFTASAAAASSVAVADAAAGAADVEATATAAAETEAALQYIYAGGRYSNPRFCDRRQVCYQRAKLNHKIDGQITRQPDKPETEDNKYEITRQP